MELKSVPEEVLNKGTDFKAPPMVGDDMLNMALKFVQLDVSYNGTSSNERQLENIETILVADAVLKSADAGGYFSEVHPVKMPERVVGIEHLIGALRRVWQLVKADAMDVHTGKSQAGSSLIETQLTNIEPIFVADEKSKRGRSNSAWQPLNMLMRVVPDDKSSSGTARRVRQNENIELKTVPDDTSYKGTSIKEVQLLNMELKSVPEEVSIIGASCRLVQALNILVKFVTAPQKVAGTTTSCSCRQLENIWTTLVSESVPTHSNLSKECGRIKLEFVPTSQRGAEGAPTLISNQE
jgi:hypothetical protein